MHGWHLTGNERLHFHIPGIGAAGLLTSSEIVVVGLGAGAGQPAGTSGQSGGGGRPGSRVTAIPGLFIHSLICCDLG